MKKDFSIAKKLLFQIIIVLILFSVCLLGLRQANLIRFPEFIENIISPSANSGSDYVGTGFEIFEHLSDDYDDVQNVFLPKIGINNLRAMLSSLETYENFYWECNSEVYSDTGSSVKECKLRVSEDRYNLEIFDVYGNVLKKYISNGVKTSISDYRSGIGSKMYQNGIFDFYSDASIISVDYFEDNVFTEDNCKIQLIEKDAFNLVSLIHTYERNGTDIRNHYMISLDYGVVLFAQCYENDSLVYNFTTNSIHPLAGLEDELFTVD